ncbi:hypothetical protein BDY19DRAFT_1057146 [Irpex rosettiformis]|uniref:Uncharacterized protein n=1 Tax=Irpex rosettiformis TaxID=378272 RepID=A0ACB8U409_9APHY|nr:hypothetical protein BDY19DRAFT_1057146 [Irpex rosettiformis]
MIIQVLPSSAFYVPYIANIISISVLLNIRPQTENNIKGHLLKYLLRYSFIRRMHPDCSDWQVSCLRMSQSFYRCPRTATVLDPHT